MKIELVYTLLDLGIQAGRSFSAMPCFVYSLSDNLSVNVNKNIIGLSKRGSSYVWCTFFPCKVICITESIDTNAKSHLDCI